MPFATMAQDNEIQSLSLSKNIKILHRHQFSNGETFNYMTYNDLVIDGDMVLGDKNSLEEKIENYEQSLKTIKPQGAMVNKCTSQFLGILWCNGFYGRKWDNNIV